MSESVDTITQDFIFHISEAMNAYRRLMAVKAPVQHLPVQVYVEEICNHG